MWGWSTNHVLSKSVYSFHSIDEDTGTQKFAKAGKEYKKDFILVLHRIVLPHFVQVEVVSVLAKRTEGSCTLTATPQIKQLVNQQKRFDMELVGIKNMYATQEHGLWNQRLGFKFQLGQLLAMWCDGFSFLTCKMEPPLWILLLDQISYTIRKCLVCINITVGY